MSEEREKKGFWARIFGIFGSRGPSAREEESPRVHRVPGKRGGEPCKTWLKRNTCVATLLAGEIDEIASNPQVVEAARESMQEEFKSGNLDPDRRPE